MLAEQPGVGARAQELLEGWSAIRFTPKAKARSMVGDRVRWYDIPEEV